MNDTLQTPPYQITLTDRRIAQIVVLGTLANTISALAFLNAFNISLLHIETLLATTLSLPVILIGTTLSTLIIGIFLEHSQLAHFNYTP